MRWGRRGVLLAPLHPSLLTILHPCSCTLQVGALTQWASAKTSPRLGTPRPAAKRVIHRAHAHAPSPPPSSRWEGMALKARRGNCLALACPRTVHGSGSGGLWRTGSSSVGCLRCIPRVQSLPATHLSPHSHSVALIPPVHPPSPPLPPQGLLFAWLDDSPEGLKKAAASEPFMPSEVDESPFDWGCNEVGGCEGRDAHVEGGLVWLLGTCRHWKSWWVRGGV